MKTWKYLPAFILLMLSPLASSVQKQRTDSTLAIGGVTRDTFYIIHENIPKNKFWGNSWYVAPSYTLSRSNEFELSVGRTYGRSFCGGAGCQYTIRSWGVGYAWASRGEQSSHLAKAFWEYSLFYLPPVGIRADYIYDITNRTHYLRPSLGISLFRIDILYNYSFKLSGEENIFGHGVTFRIKYFHRQKNWQKNYPSRC